MAIPRREYDRFMAIQTYQHHRLIKAMMVYGTQIHNTNVMLGWRPWMDGINR